MDTLHHCYLSEDYVATSSHLQSCGKLERVHCVCFSQCPVLRSHLTTPPHPAHTPIRSPHSPTRPLNHHLSTHPPRSQVLTRSQNPMVLDPKTPVAEGIAFTTALDAEMETLQTEAAALKQFQKKYRFDVTKFTALEEVSQ